MTALVYFPELPTSTHAANCSSEKALAQPTVLPNALCTPSRHRRNTYSSATTCSDALCQALYRGEACLVLAFTMALQHDSAWSTKALSSSLGPGAAPPR